MTMNYTIKTIPRTEDGVGYYLDHYEPFRLRALKTDPSAFSSSYARELAFDDDRWRSRILSQIATTLVAVADTESETSNEATVSDEKPNSSDVSLAGDIANNANKPPIILSETTVVGPIPPPPELVKYINSKGADSSRVAERRYGSPVLAMDLLVWEINAVWTAPEARRRGIAGHLLREAIRLAQAQRQTAASNQPSSEGGIEEGPRPASVGQVSRFLTVGVDKTNSTALALYTKSGYEPFSEVKEGEREYTCLYLPATDMSS